MTLTTQFKTQSSTQKKESQNHTGIPTPLKESFETAHKLSFDDVRIHYNSSAPAQFHALAYTQGSHIYLAPNQQKHLPHELGHIVQQKSHPVPATASMNGQSINNDPLLEANADDLAQKAENIFPSSDTSFHLPNTKISTQNTMQFMGERKAIRSVMHKIGIRRGIRRGNVIQDIYKTRGRSIKKVTQLRDKLLPVVEIRLRKNTFVRSIVRRFLAGNWDAVDEIASGELAKLSGAGNCGEYASATFATLAKAGFPQYIYTGCMRSTNPRTTYDHAFTITAPFQIQQEKLDAGTVKNTSDITIVDAWFNYQIIPFNKFLNGMNPYGAQLTQKNIRIETMVTPDQYPYIRLIMDDIKQEVSNVYWDPKREHFHAQTDDAIRRYQNRRGVFEFGSHMETEIPELLKDQRSPLMQCMDYLRVNTIHDFVVRFSALSPENREPYFAIYPELKDIF